MDDVLRDHETSALSGPEKALFTFLQKVNAKPAEIGQEDVDQVKRAGVSEEAIYDAITVCGLFNFYNRWCDATGVQALSPEGFAASGQRLAEHGYINK